MAETAPVRSSVKRPQAKTTRPPQRATPYQQPARKVNRRFLVFLLGVTAAVLLIGAGGFWVMRKIHSTDPHKLVQLGDAAVDKRDWETAVQCYRRALAGHESDTVTLVKLGDALEKMAPKDRQFLNQAIAVWRKTVSIDPRCVPALERLNDFYTQDAELEPRPEMFSLLRSVCDNLLAVKPGDLKVSERKQLSFVQQWLNNQIGLTDEVRDAIEKAIPALLVRDPGNPDLVGMLAAARVQQARVLLDAERKSDAQALLKKATDALDRACKDAPHDAAMQYDAYKVYRLIESVDPDAAELVESEKAKRTRKHYDDRIDAAIQSAMALSTKLDPTEPLYDNINVSAADWAAQQGRIEEQGKILRAFYQTHTKDPVARLVMAKFLEHQPDPKDRAEAIAILSEQIDPEGAATGFKAVVQQNQQLMVLAELVEARIAEIETVPLKESDRRAKMSSRLDEDLMHLRRLTSLHNPLVQGLEGQIHLLRGENVEAVKSFELAAGPPDSNVDTNSVQLILLYRLAKAYTLTGQPGAAKLRLKQVLLRADRYAAARVLLARVDLETRDIEDAKVQIRRLQDTDPTNAEIKPLIELLALNDPNFDTRTRSEVFVSLSEKDRSARLSKAQIAISLSKYDEAIRLYKDVLNETPGDAQASMQLANVYLNALNQKESARRVVDDALKAHPDEPNLVGLNARLRDLSPQETYRLVLEAIGKNPDEFARESQMYELELSPGGHPEQAYPHLVSANRVRPDDPAVLNLLFSHDLTHGNYDHAAQVAERLAAQNADQCGGLLIKWRLAQQKHDFATAEELGNQLTRQYGQFAVAWLARGQALQERGNYEKAVGDFLEVIKRQPGEYSAYQGLVECDYRLNRVNKAEEVLRQARAQFPADLRLREQLLNHMVNWGHAIDAVGDREEILKTDTDQQKDTPDDYLSLAKAYFHAAQDEAVAHPQDKAAHMNKAFKTLLQGKEKFPDQGQFYSQLAEMYQYNRDLSDGERVLQEFSGREEFKDRPEPDLALCDFYMRVNKLDSAERSLNNALAKAMSGGGSSAVDIRLRLVALLVQEQKFSVAYSTLDLLDAAYHDDPRVIQQRIEIQIAEGKRDEAKKAITAELAVHDRSELRALYASLLIDEHQLDAALKELRHILDRNPKDDVALYLQALAEAQKGQVDEGTAQLVELRNRYPSNVRVRLLLAELYEKSGKLDFAIRELDEGVQKVPLSREMRLSLIRLYRAKQPIRPEDWEMVYKLVRDAEADPVLGMDYAWAREEALYYADKTPPEPARAIITWDRVARLAPDNVALKREFIDLLLRFHNYDSVLVETQKLADAGRSDWWLHYQRGFALGRVTISVDLSADAKRKAVAEAKARSLAEFDSALKVIDPAQEASEVEFILRGVSTVDGNDEALSRLARLLPSDPDNRWRLLQASLLRAKSDFAGADAVITDLLADPANKKGERRFPILRAKCDIWENRPIAEHMSGDRAQGAYLKARDAYVEALKIRPDDLICLNNLACLLSDKVNEPDGGPRKAKEYSSRAYELIRFDRAPNTMVLDTQGWVLTLCGGGDSIEGLDILRRMMEERTDTRGFVEGKYHLAEAYLHLPKPDTQAAQKWLKDAMNVIRLNEEGGTPVDPVVKDEVQTALSKVSGPDFPG